MPKTLEKNLNEIDTIRSDLKTLSDGLKSLTSHVEAQGKMTAADIKLKAQENIANFQDYSRGQLQAVEKEIKAKPAQSVAIAFGAGVLASFLLSRRG